MLTLQRTLGSVAANASAGAQVTSHPHAPSSHQAATPCMTSGPAGGSQASDADGGHHNDSEGDAGAAAVAEATSASPRMKRVSTSAAAAFEGKQQPVPPSVPTVPGLGRPSHLGKQTSFDSGVSLSYQQQSPLSSDQPSVGAGGDGAYKAGTLAKMAAHLADMTGSVSNRCVRTAFVRHGSVLGALRGLALRRDSPLPARTCTCFKLTSSTLQGQTGNRGSSKQRG